MHKYGNIIVLYETNLALIIYVTNMANNEYDWPTLFHSTIHFLDNIWQSLTNTQLYYRDHNSIRFFEINKCIFKYVMHIII